MRDGGQQGGRQRRVQGIQRHDQPALFPEDGHQVVQPRLYGPFARRSPLRISDFPLLGEKMDFPVGCVFASSIIYNSLHGFYGQFDNGCNHSPFQVGSWQS